MNRFFNSGTNVYSHQERVARHSFFLRLFRPAMPGIVFILTGLLACLLPGAPLSAQHLDEVRFGDPASETKHGMVSYDLSKSEVYTGQGGQKARRFLPNNKNPYQGNYPGIYGGEISFVMKVDSTQQNYFTLKFAGDEANSGRILLNVEGKELGSRHGGNEEVFMDLSNDNDPISPGAFFFRTAPLPRTLTNNKTVVTIRLRSTGRFYAYGTPNVYETYQRVLETPTTGVYKAYLHTNPAFALPTDDQQGNTPSYETAPGNGTSDPAQVKANIIATAQNKINGLLNGNDYLKPNSNNFYNDIEALAVAYQMPYNAVAYQNPAVITKIRKAIDQLVVNANNKTQTANACWGGCFGRPAYAVSLVYDQLTGLDEVVNLGGGTTLTRREQWAKLFKESFDFGATNRKTITNQEMECAMSVYGASLGLAKIDPAKYGELPKVAVHHALEACGIEEFSGSLTNLSAPVPTLGTPPTSSKGAGYFWMTKKGTSHEPGWVSIDCYGNLSHKLIEFWRMTKHDPNVTTNGVGNGDQRILDMATTHNRTQTSFTYPWTQDGKKCMLAEGCTCWRNVYLPGKAHYGSPLVAAASQDAVAFGFMRQMINDGRLNYFQSNNPQETSFQFLPEAIDQIAAATSTTKIPSTPGEPDYVSADEENGVIAIKKGAEMFFVTLYNRAYSDNKSAKAHHITPVNERKIEFKPDRTEFYASGKSVTRTDNVTGDFSGNAPDKPVSGYSGQVEAYPSYNHSTAYHVDRAILDFYQVRYGKYLIAMNTTKDLTKTLAVPADMSGKNGYDVAARTSATLPASISVPPLTTMVYYVADVPETPGLLPDNSPMPDGVNKGALTTKLTNIETFATQPTTVDKVSTIEIGGNYRYNLFEVLIRQIAVAKYTRENEKATQAQVDNATTDLVAAYEALIGNPYATLNPFERIEAEKFSSQNGLQTEATRDVDGNLNLSFVDANDWATYTGYDFKTKGATKFYVRYSVPGTAATTLEVRLDSKTGPLVGKCTLQSTGGNQNWKTDSCIIAAGVQGKKTFTLVFGGRVNVNWIRFDSTDRSGIDQTMTFTPIGDQKTTASPDVPISASVSSGLAITFSVSDPKVALISGNKLRFIGAGTTTITASQPGDWTYKPVSIAQTITVTAATQPAPFRANQIPGTIEGENYDYGGEGLAYHNTSTTSNSSYRPGDRIETEVSAQSNGYNVSFVFGTEWMNYTLDVTKAGTYTVGLRYAYNQPVSTLREFTISVDGTIVGTYNANATASWTNYQTYTFPITFATAGSHVLRITLGGPASQSSFNIDKLTFTLTQRIDFPPIATKSLWEADFEPGATASSGLPVSYRSSDTAVATLVGGKLHPTGAGTTTITAFQAGNDVYPAAEPVSQTLTVFSPIRLSYQNGAAGQPTNNQTKPNLALLNEGSIAVPYNELTIRYWLTAENYAGINTWIDYAQVGSGNVKAKYVPLDQPHTGAFGYVEYSFEASAGSLAANSNSGPIQSRFANTNWATLTELDDYSYQNAASYVPNDHITLYRNGKLVWGLEPSPTPPVVKLTAYSENKNSNTGANTISTYLNLKNEGNVPVAYENVVVRYWFTAEGTQPLNYWVDYAVLGSAKVTGQFTRNVNRHKADTYFELGVKPSAGVLYPASSTGNIQYRIAKTDWSNFDETNDYSYKSAAALDTNTRVTVYNKETGGELQLIYGTEPAALSGARLSGIGADAPFRVVVLENPVPARVAEIVVYGTGGQPLTLSLTDVQGRSLTTQHHEGVADGTHYSVPLGSPSGMYLLRASLPAQSLTLKVVKP